MTLILPHIIKVITPDNFQKVVSIKRCKVTKKIKMTLTHFVKVMTLSDYRTVSSVDL